MVKKKKSNANLGEGLVSQEGPADGETAPTGGDCHPHEGSETGPSSKVVPPFKKASFVGSRAAASSKKSKGWKSLKQITGSEKPQPGTGVTYSSLDASPSRRPSQKFSDLTGLPAKYKDPMSHLFYFNGDEFAQIRMLSPDIVTGYLELRKANV